MVSQLGTLLIVFGFLKYGKEYCSISYKEIFDWRFPNCTFRTRYNNFQLFVLQEYNQVNNNNSDRTLSIIISRPKKNKEKINF
jgi:hypothetical protein